MPGKQAGEGTDAPNSWGCGLAFLGAVASIALLFVSPRHAVAVGAAAVEFGLIVQMWPLLVRPVARICFVGGVIALVGGAAVACFQPWPAVAAVLCGAGLLGCLSGLALVARSAPSTDKLTEAFGGVLFIPGVYLALVGIGALIAGARPAGQVVLVVAGALLAVACVVFADEDRRWYWRVLSIAVALVAALGVAALFFDRYRLAGVAVVGLSLGYPVIQSAARGDEGGKRVAAPWGLVAGYYGAAATVGMLFVSDRLAVVVGAATTGAALAVRAWEVLVRPAAKILFLAGVAALAAGTAVLCYQPWPAVAAGLFGAGVLGCAAGLVVSGRPVPPQLTDVVGSVLLFSGMFVGLAGFGALVVHARTAGQLSLMVAATLVALSFGVWAGQRRRWYERLVRVLVALGLALGGSALFFDRFRLAGLVLLGLVVGYGLVRAVWTWPRRRRAAQAAHTAPGSPGQASPPRVPDDLPVRDVVAGALRLAATERPDGEALTTGQVLAALVRMDIHADWQRIWLHTGDPVVTLGTAPDPASVGAATEWRGIPITRNLAEALAVLQRLTSAYPDLYPAGSGATMLALVAHPANGATATLLRHNQITHAHLLRLVQSDIINLTLPGLATIIPAAR